MEKTTILTNDKVTAVFHQDKFAKDSKVYVSHLISYYTVDGDLLKEGNVTKEAGISAFKKLIAKGYKVVAKVERV